MEEPVPEIPPPPAADDNYSGGGEFENEEAEIQELVWKQKLVPSWISSFFPSPPLNTVEVTANS